MADEWWVPCRTLGRTELLADADWDSYRALEDVEVREFDQRRYRSRLLVGRWERWGPSEQSKAKLRDRLFLPPFPSLVRSNAAGLVARIALSSDHRHAHLSRDTDYPGCKGTFSEAASREEQSVVRLPGHCVIRQT